MKTACELKAQAWGRLWRDGWFWRLFGGTLLLQFCTQLILSFVGGVRRSLGVDSWWDYLMAVQGNSVTLTTPVPKLTRDYVLHATSATCLDIFFTLILSGILSYGCAVILRRCLDDERPGWLGASFGGFRAPFGMMGLFLRLTLVYMGWMFLAAFAVGLVAGACYPLAKNLDMPVRLAFGGVAATAAVLAILLSVMVPFYRYRFLWLVRAEHPDWGVGACFAECRRLTDGSKMRSFRLDCAYWLPLAGLLLLACVGLAFVCAGFGLRASPAAKILSALGVLTVSVLFLPLVCVVTQYISVGQGFLYRELKEAAR